MYTNEFVHEYFKAKELLYQEYVINKLSPHDIYLKYNCEAYINNSETLLHFFRDIGFPIRSHSEAVSDSWLFGKYKCVSGIQYHQEWHTTWNNKNVYLHSSYEVIYAKELDSKKIDYEVGTIRIQYWDSQKQKYRCAIPDFYLPETNDIVEIKSTWTLDVQNMKDKKKEYLNKGYNFKLICDFKEMYI